MSIYCKLSKNAKEKKIFDQDFLNRCLARGWGRFTIVGDWRVGVAYIMPWGVVGTGGCIGRLGVTDGRIRRLGVTYLMPGASYDGWKHGTRGVVSGEPGLAHTGAIVHYESCYVVVTHDDLSTNKK